MENNTNQGNDRPFRNSGQTFMTIMIVAVAIFFLYTLVRQFFVSGITQELSYTEFVGLVEEDKIDRVIWSDTEITVFPKEGVTIPPEEEKTPASAYLEQLPVRYYVVPVNAAAEQLTETLLSHGISIYKKKPDNSAYYLEMAAMLILPTIGLFILMNVMMRRMGGGGNGIMGVGKSTAKMYMQRETGITFKDVAGEDEAKESLIEIVDFLHDPGKYTAIGAKLPKGALLVGPPGTGKTLLAKAVAGEAKVPFYSLSGSDFVEMFVGVGASRVRDLFKQATQTAPCIIFIDEIDAIGKTRDTRVGGNDEREQTLNQLLSEMDGFDPSKGIMVMGATNRPEILDPALLRPGRFDRRIVVEKPDLKGRVNILKVHARDVQLDESVDFHEIALATSGAVGADLANMMNEAAITAVKNGRKKVSQKDLFEAVEVVLVGKEKKDRILSKEERRIVSYHEVGHALVSAVQKDSEPVQKITIVPRTMGALGYVMQVPEEEKYLNTKRELEAMLVSTLAGRAAEELVFSTVTTGAANDIEKATRLARAMVTQYGMSEKFGLMGLETVESMYLSGRTVMNCGDDTATDVDREVMLILKRSYQEAKRILQENRFALDRIAEFLIQRETITGKEFMQILHDVQEEEKLQKTGGSPLAPASETVGQRVPDSVASEQKLPMAEASASGASRMSAAVPAETITGVSAEPTLDETSVRTTAETGGESRKASFEEVFAKYTPAETQSSYTGETASQKETAPAGETTEKSEV